MRKMYLSKDTGQAYFLHGSILMGCPFSISPLNENDTVLFFCESYDCDIKGEELKRIKRLLKKKDK